MNKKLLKIYIEAYKARDAFKKSFDDSYRTSFLKAFTDGCKTKAKDAGDTEGATNCDCMTNVLKDLQTDELKEVSGGNMSKNFQDRIKTQCGLPSWSDPFYATQRLSHETSPFLLAKQMWTSVEMLEKFYGQTVTSALAAQITKGNQGGAGEKEKSYPFGWMRVTLLCNIIFGGGRGK